MKAIIFDTETTGKHEPQIIEAAWIAVESPTNLSGGHFERRYKPSKPIELGAMAVHHIIDEELVHCPLHTEFKLPDGLEFIIGHNVDYDWQVSGSPQVKRICTLALAREYLPDLDSHTQSALIYHFSKLDAKYLLTDAHSALADVHNCRLILEQLLKIIGPISTWEELWGLSEKARIPKVMPFGKHKGEQIANIPSDYKRWLLRQPDIDQYLLVALG